jgi:hypothetical protein
VKRDLDAILRGWEYQPGMVQARLVTAGDGRSVLQMRLDLGVFQMEATDRPDGDRPHGFATYFDYLKAQASDAGDGFALTEEQGQEADREFMQFYHRRVCWLALHHFNRAVEDADHTLAFMDFVRDHSPGDEFTLAHEQYRGFVLFHRTQAAAARAAEAGDPEGAIDAIGEGLTRLRRFFADYELAERMEEDGMVQQLRRLEKSLRQLHQIDATLRERLDRAVANEEYETAARLRDELRQRG